MNATAKEERAPKPRYALLDELRGLALISMMGYHAMWDLVYMFGLDAPWYGGLGPRADQEGLRHRDGFW